MDPDQGGPNTYGNDGSEFGCATLVISNLKNTASYSILKYVPAPLPRKKGKDQCKNVTKNQPRCTKKTLSIMSFMKIASYVSISCKAGGGGGDVERK
jgi:hypothetical protein